MNPNPTPTIRIAFAAAALAVALGGASSIASGFLPADPHVAEVRAQALLDRTDRMRDAASPVLIRTASAMPTLR